jgi:hypothetical protein
MRKIRAIIVILIILLLAAHAYTQITGRDANAVVRNIPRKESPVIQQKESITAEALRPKIYNYLKADKNQRSVFKEAMALNEGKSANACVYFVSEVLRRASIDLSEDTCNTGQLVAKLENRGWEKYKDYKMLKPGDVCFTTDIKGDKNGRPTHTFIFMGWVKENNYDYAYICDNQAKDYDNKVYHIRNIKYKGEQEGIEKEAFSYFMAPA